MLPARRFATGTLPADLCGAARRAGIVPCVEKAASATARHSECDNHGRMGGRGDKLAGKICLRCAPGAGSTWSPCNIGVGGQEVGFYPQWRLLAESRERQSPDWRALRLLGDGGRQSAHTAECHLLQIQRAMAKPHSPPFYTSSLTSPLLGARAIIDRDVKIEHARIAHSERLYGCGLYLEPVQYGCRLYLEPVQ